MNLLGPHHIALSRRNLLTLLKMLDQNVGEPTLRRTLAGGDHTIRVTAEEDTHHYASKAREPVVRGVQGVGPDDVR